MDNDSTALPERWVFGLLMIFFLLVCARGKTIDREEGVDRIASRLAVPSCLRKRGTHDDDDGDDAASVNNL